MGGYRRLAPKPLLLGVGGPRAVQLVLERRSGGGQRSVCRNDTERGSSHGGRQNSIDYRDARKNQPGIAVPGKRLSFFALPPQPWP